MDTVIKRITQRIVGRQEEITVILSALESGRNIFLEGPPGTSKSTILRVVVEELGRPFHWITGNSDLTATKLLGYFDPSLVLSHGYKPENFEYGALTKAMVDGGILYVEEFNRLPDDTCNAFISAMSERSIPIPRLGTVEAKPTFCVVASLNPYDDAGTLNISRALRDRFCSIRMDYQLKNEEIEIVWTQVHNQISPPTLHLPNIVEASVEMSRRTRVHPDLRMGSSVRGAIDMALLAIRLIAHNREFTSNKPDLELLRTAAHAALRDKIRVNEVSDQTSDEILDAIWASFVEDSKIDDEGLWDLGLLDDGKKKTQI